MDSSEGNPLQHETTGSAEKEEIEPEQVRLSSRQMRALPIIAASSNLTQAAQDAGISEKTLRRWRQDEHFRAELDRLTAEIADTTRQGLRDIMLQGLSVVTDLMEDPDPAVRLRAARAAITMGMRVCEADNLRRGDPEARGCLLGQAMNYPP